MDSGAFARWYLDLGMAGLGLSVVAALVSLWAAWALVQRWRHRRAVEAFAAAETDEQLRGVLRGGSGPLAASVTLVGAPGGESWRAEELALECEDGRSVALSGPVAVVAGTRVRTSRGGTPRAGHHAADHVLSAWVRDRRAGAEAVVVSTVQAGDPVVVFGEVVSEAGDGERGYREPAVRWSMRGGGCGAIRVSAQRPAALRVRASTRAVLSVALVAAAAHWVSWWSVGRGWRQQCAALGAQARTAYVRSLQGDSSARRALAPVSDAHVCAIAARAPFGDDARPHLLELRAATTSDAHDWSSEAVDVLGAHDAIQWLVLHGHAAQAAALASDSAHHELAPVLQAAAGGDARSVEIRALVGADDWYAAMRLARGLGPTAPVTSRAASSAPGSEGILGGGIVRVQAPRPRHLPLPTAPVTPLTLSGRSSRTKGQSTAR